MHQEIYSRDGTISESHGTILITITSRRFDIYRLPPHIRCKNHTFSLSMETVMSTTTYLDFCHCDTVKLIIPLDPLCKVIHSDVHLNPANIRSIHYHMLSLGKSSQTDPLGVNSHDNEDITAESHPAG